jgi:hypothetical protein
MTVFARTLITAENASFLRAWDGAARSAEAGSKRIIGAAGGIKTAVSAIVGSAVVAGLTSIVRAQVQVVDSFNDLSDATGASIENISGLESLGRRTGTTFESVGGILVKFNAALKDAKPDNDAGQAFNRLGLDLQRLRDMDPAEALRLTAIALQGFANDGTKARIVQELFGKSIREAAPLLKDLAEAGGLMATVTTQQAEAAERFNKQLMALTANAEDLKRELVMGLVPALGRMLQNFKEIREAGGVDLILKDAARGLVPGLSPKLSGDPGEGINKIISERTQLEKQLAAAVKDGRGMHVKTLKEEIFTLNRYLEVLRIKQRTEVLSSASGQDVGDAVSRRLQQDLPRLKPLGAGKSKKEDISEASTRLASYVDQLSKAAEKTADLSEEQKALNFLLSLGSTGEVPQVRELVLGLAIRRDIAEREDEIGKIRAKNDAAAVGAVAARSAENDQLAEHLVQMQLEIEEIGLTAEALERLKLTRLDNNIARAQEDLLRAKGIEGNESEISQIERRIRLLQRERELAGQGVGKRADAKAADESKEFAATLNQDVKSALSNAFRDSKNPIGAFGDALGNVVYTRLTEAAATALADMLVGKAATGAIGGLLGSLFGGFRASGGPVAANTLYRVNERGPELLQTGGRQYLMMGNRGGNVVPNRGGSGGGQVINITINNAVGNIASQVDVVKGMQIVRAQIMQDFSRRGRYGGVPA